MKHIKTYKLFESVHEINDDDIFDIFIPVLDHGLKYAHCKKGTFASMGNKKIIDNHKELTGSFTGISVRLDNNGIIFDDLFFDDLDNSIKHFESKLNCKLNSIFVRTPGGQWFSDVSALKNLINSINFNHTRYILFIDIVFEF